MLLGKIVRGASFPLYALWLGRRPVSTIRCGVSRLRRSRETRRTAPGRTGSAASSYVRYVSYVCYVCRNRDTTRCPGSDVLREKGGKVAWRWARTRLWVSSRSPVGARKPAAVASAGYVSYVAYVRYVSYRAASYRIRFRPLACGLAPPSVASSLPSMVTFSTSSTFPTSLSDLEYRRRSIPFEERAASILRSREVRAEKAERGGSRCVGDSSLIQGAARGLRPVGDLRRRPAEAPRRSGGAMRARPPRKACPRRDGLSRCARRRPTCRPAGLAQCPLPATSPTLSTFPTSSDEQYLGKAVFTLRPAVAPLMGQAVVSDCRLRSLRSLRLR